MYEWNWTERDEARLPQHHAERNGSSNSNTAKGSIGQYMTSYQLNANFVRDFRFNVYVRQPSGLCRHGQACRQHQNVRHLVRSVVTC
eukprot:scaffold45460_cov47-Prasinocladus_malaysianus.AAC.1